MSVTDTTHTRQPPCFTRPADWWDTDSDMARLAIGLCSVCPQAAQCAADALRGAAGTIRAGVPYDDRGTPMAVCHCGYPNSKPDGCCRRCAVPNVAVMSRREYHRLYARRRTWRESKQRARAA